MILNLLEPTNCSCKDEDEWTASYLVERLKQHLAMVDLSDSTVKTDLLDEDSNYDSHKYYNQAYHYLKIGVFNPVPKFLISLSDLSPKLIKELFRLDLDVRDFVLKQTISRIFEDINSKLYHDSVSKVLKVKLVD